MGKEKKPWYQALCKTWREEKQKEMEPGKLISHYTLSYF